MLALQRATAHLSTVNGYGLIAVMTTPRDEIALEGSADGKTWRAYRFRWKPNAPDERPRFAGLHMPRLDWQLWFAALRGRPPSWFGPFARRLLEAEPSVLALLATSPNGDAPPRFLRARLERYQFTTRRERAETGHWWSREALSAYLPTVRLDPTAHVDGLRSRSTRQPRRRTSP